MQLCCISFSILLCKFFNILNCSFTFSFNGWGIFLSNALYLLGCFLLKEVRIESSAFSNDPSPVSSLTITGGQFSSSGGDYRGVEDGGTTGVDGSNEMNVLSSFDALEISEKTNIHFC